MFELGWIGWAVVGKRRQKSMPDKRDHLQRGADEQALSVCGNRVSSLIQLVAVCWQTVGSLPEKMSACGLWEAVNSRLRNLDFIQ